MITSIDHIVLTTSDIDRCISFYTKVLGMTLHIFGDERKWSNALYYDPNREN